MSLFPFSSSSKPITLIWDRNTRVIKNTTPSVKQLGELGNSLKSGQNLDEAMHQIAWATHATSSSKSAIPRSSFQLEEGKTFHALSLPGDKAGTIQTVFLPVKAEAATPEIGSTDRLGDFMRRFSGWRDLREKNTTGYLVALTERVADFFEAEQSFVLSEARRMLRGGTDTGILSRLFNPDGEPPALPDHSLELLGALCGDATLGIGNHSRAEALGPLLGFSVLTDETRYLLLLHRAPKGWSPEELESARGCVPALQLEIEKGLAQRNVSDNTSLLQSALGVMDDGALLLRYVDGRGIITQVNDPFLRTFGLGAEAVIGNSGRTVIELMRPHLPDPSSVNHLMQLVQDTASEQALEVNLAGEDQVVLRVNSAPCRNAQGEVIARILYFHDITKDKEIEQQLLHSQKMESIGTLAGGVAHDFNNLLTTMLGNTELLRRDVKENEAALAKLGQIEKSGRRAAELTGSLLAFSRRNPTIFRVIRLNEIIEETLSILRSSIPATIEIALKPDPEIPYVEADSTQLEQVLINLALNARDAMSGEGKIAIATYTSRDPQSLDDPEAPLYAVLEVADNGVGIAQENLHRVFEPFYTTKEVGKGTGLGLAMVYGIVKKHGGFIEVKSAPGMGSRFSVFIPTTTKSPTDYATGAGDSGSILGRKNYSILVVDDESDLLAFCTAALEEHCQRIDTATNGLDAIRIFEEDPHAYDLVLLDLTMPRMSGADCYRRLSQVNPGVRVLISSGYSLNEDGKQLIANGAVGFLPKPYSVDQLLKAVAKALKSTPNVNRSPRSDEPPEAKPPRAEAPSSMIFGSTK